MSLYVVRLTRTGNRIDSRPCQSCYQTLCAYKIKRVIYSVTPTTYECVKVTDYVPNKMSEGDAYFQSLH